MPNVNICFQDQTYNKIKDLVERRKISRFVNEAVEEKLRLEEQYSFQQQLKKEIELRKKLTEEYKANANNKKFQEAMKIWDEATEDILGPVE